jgi:hypothetical protein
MNKIKYTLALLAIIAGFINLKAQVGSGLWSTVGPINTPRLVSELNPFGNELLAGLVRDSTFDTLSVAKWNGLFWQYYPSFKVKTYNPLFCAIYLYSLFATGHDSGATNQLHIRKFDGSAWTDVDVPLINKASVNDNEGGITVINNELYLFGTFVNSSLAYMNILKYSGGAWSVIGTAGKPGVTGNVINVIQYKGGLLLQGSQNLSSNDSNLVSRNLIWNGARWKRFDNYLDSTDILYNDHDTLFYKKDTLIYKYYNGSSTSISNNLRHLVLGTSTFVSIKGVYYYYGTFRLNGASTIYYFSFAMRKDNIWYLLEQNGNRSGIVDFQDKIFCKTSYSMWPANKKVEKLNHGFAFISGNIYNDVNKNCVKDAGEAGLHLPRNISIMPDNVLTISDNLGSYSALVTPGSKTIYNSGLQSAKYQKPSPCSSVVKTTTAVADSVSIVNFPMYDSLAEDVAVKIQTKGGTRIRKLNNDNVTVDLINVGGTLVSSGVVSLLIDNQLTIISSTPSYTSFNNNIVTWNFTNLQKDEVRKFKLDVQLSINAVLNDSINYVAKVRDTLDVDTADNMDSLKCRIVYSYDPNFKVCNPAEIILANTVNLQYTIHFQNTGTSHAINVRVIDTLDTDLPMNQVVFTGWSTPKMPDFHVEGNRILVFTFPNINLPDSFSDEKGSHGYVNYYCGLYKNLPYGTQITNRAHIYFDYNVPVPTNQTENQRNDNVGVKNGKQIELTEDVSVFPNPSNNEIHITSQSFEMNTITIMDINGKILSVNKTGGIKDMTIKISQWPDGVYFVKLENNKEALVKKIIIRH